MRNNRITGIIKRPGTWEVKFQYYGKPYSYCTRKSLAIDRIYSYYGTERSHRYGYTLNQAWNALYEEGLRIYHLGKYKY